MTDQDLADRLKEVFAAAQRRHRKTSSWSLPIPVSLLDQAAVGLAPLLRELVDAAVTAHLADKENAA